MAEYLIKENATSASGIHVNLFLPSIIEGTFKLHDNTLYSTVGMSDRAATSINKIVGFTDLLTGGKDSARFGYKCVNNAYHKIYTYVHDNSKDYVLSNPAKFICDIEAGDEVYFRLEDKNYEYVFQINDIVVVHPKSKKKMSVRYQNYPYFQLADSPAMHDMNYSVTRK
jgi:hypothetical protein